MSQDVQKTLTARLALDRAQEALLKAAREKRPLGELANDYRAAIEAYQATWSGQKAAPDEFVFDEEDGHE